MKKIVLGFLVATFVLFGSAFSSIAGYKVEAQFMCYGTKAVGAVKLAATNPNMNRVQRLALMQSLYHESLCASHLDNPVPVELDRKYTQYKSIHDGNVYEVWSIKENPNVFVFIGSKTLGEVS